MTKDSIVIKDDVPARYEFKKTSSKDNAIEHGWIQQTNGANIKVDASFLYFKIPNHARNVHRNLSRLKGENFLESHFVIERKEGCWVAVEKIDQTLEEYRNSNNFSWIDSNKRLPLQYPVIIRDIIRGMCQLHQQKHSNGSLSKECIMIIKDRAKLAFILNNHLYHKKTDFDNLKILFKDVLGGKENHTELTHFHESVSKLGDVANLRKLYFHPLLMSREERFQLPIRADTRVHYGLVGAGAGAYGQLFERVPHWADEVHIKRDYDYLTVLDRNKYDDSLRDLLRFVRNTIVHINQNIEEENKRALDRWKEQCEREQRLIERGLSSVATPTTPRPTRIQKKSWNRVEEDLSSMFPYFLCKLYDLLKLDEITPFVRS